MRSSKLPKEHWPKSFLDAKKAIIHPFKRRLARYYLLFLKKYFDMKVIAITGSAGKTTTKEMVASILKRDGPTISSRANIDPVYNIPTVILKCRPWTKYLVLEMGVEFKGEMDFYLWLATPDIAVITNVYPTHTEFFGSQKGVLLEKSKIVKGLKKAGIAILNKEEKLLVRLGKELKREIIWYGQSGQVKAKHREISENLKTKYTLYLDLDKINIQLPVLGEQFVSNSLAAAAVGLTLGLPINLVKRGLEEYHKPKHRMEIFKLKNESLVIDDSYNNNPMAAREALKTLKEIAGKREKIIVFGDMLELGKLEAKYHRQIGELVGELGARGLIGVGKASRLTVSTAAKKMGKKKVFWVERQEQVLPLLRPFLESNAIVLVKGSRSIGLDDIIIQLKHEFQ